MIPIEFVLFVFLIATALAVLVVRDLFAAAMLFGIFSLLSSGMMLMMDAVDVSFTEAAVGAGISTVLILGALSLTDSSEKTSTHHQWSAKLVVVATGALLIFGTFDMPHYGAPEAPIHNHVSRTVIEIPNIVTSVLASYRGFDTFGETTVVLTALVGVMLLLGGSRKGEDEAPEMTDEPEAS
jgi:multicomponent Na+:H+ antiporter subunit B